MSPSDGAPEEFDQTIFAVGNDRTLGPVEGLTQNLVKEQQRYYLILNDTSDTDHEFKYMHVF